MKPFYFDLDGPILDVSEKYYRVYFDILKSEGYDVIDKNRYWNAKRSKVPEIEILKWTEASSIYKEYKLKRIDLIESESYQQFDQLHPGAVEILNEFSSQFNLKLVTLRSSKDQTLRQLEQLDILPFFSQVLSRSGDSNPEKWKIKVDLIRELEGEFQLGTSFIGDTETDIKAAKAIGAVSFAVESGIRSRELLEKESPDYIISGIEGLRQYF